MIQEAKQFKAADDAQRQSKTAKNELESYIYNMKAMAEDEKLKDKISKIDKKAIIDKCNETIEWLDNNQVDYFNYFFKLKLGL